MHSRKESVLEEAFHFFFDQTALIAFYVIKHVLHFNTALSDQPI